MIIETRFLSGNRVELVGSNPSGPNPVISLEQRQAVTLAKVILAKYEPCALKGEK